MEIKLTGTQMKLLEEIKRKPCCIEDLSKNLHKSYSHIYEEIRGLKIKCVITEVRDVYDKRKKILSLTTEGNIILEKEKLKKSSIAKLDSWLDKKFSEIGIDCARLFG